MSWREDLMPASFRGVPFYVLKSDSQFGRTVSEHAANSAPSGSKDRVPYPFVEDSGRRTRKFDVQGYVIGDAYLTDRNRLIDAVEKPGAGELVHPYYGVRNVVGTCRVEESTSEGGWARFTFSFVEAGEQPFPVAASATSAIVETDADAATGAVSDTYQPDLDQPSWVLEDLSALIGEAGTWISRASLPLRKGMAAVARFERDLESFLDRVDELVDLPVDLILQLSGFAQRLADAGSRNLFDGFADDWPPVSGTTATREAQAANRAALIRSFKAAGAIAEARASASRTFRTRDEAMAEMDRLVGRLTDIAADAPDDLYLALHDLSAAVVTDIAARAFDLARLGSYTPPRTVPSLVLAYRLYGDPMREEEVITLNAISNPCLVPGGVALEVLSFG